MAVRIARGVVLSAALALLAQAHVGSPDIYLDGKAGAYELFVTVRPPTVIPGVAELEIRCETPGVREIRAVPMPMAGVGARFAPVPEKLKVSSRDAQFFTGSLWMMTPGSWQVRLTVEGSKGQGALAVPVPSAALATKKMQRGLGIVLVGLGIFLVGGLVAIVGASVREAKLQPGDEPGFESRRRGRIAMSIAFAVLIGVVWFGDRWWSSEANSYEQDVYKPLRMNAALNRSGVLTLKLTDPGWLKPRRPGFRNILFERRIDDLVPDHDHLMHLYLIRQPGLDVVFHLHPDQVETGAFRLNLPSMPAGTYKLYADIVHANGFPETMVATIDLPQVNGRALAGDDSSGTAIPWSANVTQSGKFLLPDRYRMEWVRESSPLRAKEPVLFRFRLLDPQGHAPGDMALYMGMPGHAAFVKTDGTVFAHIHPSGSVSMAALMLAQNQIAGKTSAARNADARNGHAGHENAGG